MSDAPLKRLTPEEIAAECGTALPAKEVLSLLDLNVNVDLLLDLAAPVGLAVGANANIAAPINAAVDGNVLSTGSEAQAGAYQTGAVHQGIDGNATATSGQTSSIAQGGGTTTPGGATTTSSTGSALNGNLLNLNVDVNGNLNLTSPINGAVAAQANAAVPIDAAVSANVGSTDSTSIALSEQHVSIDQGITGNATATAHQISGITQGSTPADTGASTPTGAADSGATTPTAPADTGASTSAGAADSSGTQPSS